MGFKAEALGLQRNGATTSKGIIDGRRIAVGGRKDEAVGGRKHPLIVTTLPLHQQLNETEEALAALFGKGQPGPIGQGGGREEINLGQQRLRHTLLVGIINE
ncbi:hypothetical protein [Candidatus Viridilinea mediisalina]|uniref:hypothetical protein n=1 Tax=Candidatus Viridilinea mediisalina TaxID=2024553 RepID=UPI001FE3CE6D|nr:hypothetical protein [Candidatus Viridilinea mediisalina]